MKKICISTYCEYSSYGSILQTIGLKNTLKEIGFESFVVKDNPAPSAYLPRKRVFSKNIKLFVKNVLNLRIRKKQELYYQNTLSFINKYVDIRYYNDYNVLKQTPPDADYYMAGSDQIWHPALCKPSFFLDFVPDNKKRLSYAASMGVTDITKEKKESFTRLISKMDSFSVREEDVKNVIKQYTNKDVQVHIDPTFLRSFKEWRNYEEAYPIKRPYILVYALYWDKNLNKKLKKLHKESKMDIVAICSNVCSVYANKYVYDANPAQFLWLIDNAEAVVTSSFHGVAFSIIFNKKLAVVINPKAPSRIENLLQVLQVSSSCIENVLRFDLAQYQAINVNIEKEKEKSFGYLKRVLTDE